MKHNQFMAASALFYAIMALDITINALAASAWFSGIPAVAASSFPVMNPLSVILSFTIATVCLLAGLITGKPSHSF